jgi:hypothetical protein
MVVLWVAGRLPARALIPFSVLNATGFGPRWSIVPAILAGGVRLGVPVMSNRETFLLFWFPHFGIHIRISEADLPDLQSALCGVPCLDLGACPGGRVGGQKPTERVCERPGRPYWRVVDHGM